ncbi:MAG TPA: class I adenylate-forming enzyme family protein [Polyangiaceae bacterium]|jgi:O-succinylbenzoic acid--CoA ligase|nr:class I adenylate-forming enzyme family protein [Polyangiaceae bacterium]
MFSIFDAARDAADREALVCDGARTSFAELGRRSAVRASQLRALGLEPAQTRPVALIVDQSLPMFEVLYALLELGVPLLPLHPRLTAPERASLMTRSASLTLIDPERLEPIPHQVVEHTPIPASLGAIDHEHPLAIVPSSGSSGEPKLVELSRRAFFELARSDAERLPPQTGDRALLCMPLSHVGGLSVVLRSLAARRACVVFRATKAGVLSAAGELAATLSRERISLLSLVPPVLARLLREAPAFAQKAPLRALLLGGQACSLELFGEARARGVPLLTSYGLTETCSQASTLAFPPPSSVATRGAVLSSGFPLPRVELRVRNGLIEVRGPTLFSRYLAGPNALDDEGFFNTGDRGELDPEAGLFVFGRASELIITGGENVDPSEVEHALLACPNVEAACVFGVSDREFGETVAVALEARAGAERDEQALFGALDARLAGFKQPRMLCWFDELPRLGSGKLDRSRIRAEAGARLREPVRR